MVKIGPNGQNGQNGLKWSQMIQNGLKGEKLSKW